MKYREIYKALERRWQVSPGFRFVDYSGWHNPRSSDSRDRPLWIIVEDKLIGQRIWITQVCRSLSITYAKMDEKGVCRGNSVSIRCKDQKQMVQNSMPSLPTRARQHKGEAYMKGTKNYQAYCRLLLNDSPVSVLLQVRSDLMKAQEPPGDAAAGAICKINAYTKPFRSNAKCPRCGGLLYLSDLPQYAYVCYDCDENFFNVEVVHGEDPHGDK